MADRETGTVKWFNTSKGYGFIQRKNGKDIFVHKNAIRNRFEELKEGDRVEFAVIQGQKGPQADDVIVVVE
jgi:CspA family cold shock protein